MKEKKDSAKLAKLMLKKETISHLDVSHLTRLKRPEMDALQAGNNFRGCWENLWTIYFCGEVCTNKDNTGS